MPKEIILVTGATGRQGGAAAQALLRHGARVRALTRSPEKAAALAKAGAEVVKGDFNDPASLAAAMRGTHGVFAMSTPFEAGLEAEVSQGIALAEAARAAAVRHFVFSSVIGAPRGTGVPHFETKFRIEQRIKSLGLPATILRPSFFMENFGTWLLPSILRGTLAAPLHPQTPVPMVALKDIGEFAAAAFRQPELFLNREIELAGDTLTFPKVCQALSAVMGRAVAFQEIPEERAEALMGRDVALMYKWFDEGFCEVDTAGLERAYGLRMTRFVELLAGAEWARPAPAAAEV